MKRFIIGIIIGAVLCAAVFEFFLLPAVKHGGNNYAVGYDSAVDDLIAKIEKEFETTEKVESKSQVLLSNESKTVLIKEHEGVKTLQVYGN